MSKLKVKCKDNQIIVTSKLEKTERINQQQLSVMQSKIIRGLMKPSVENSRKISYFAPNGITLKKYLSTNISKNDFFLVFAQILEVLKSVNRNSFDINNLILDLNYLFVNEITNELYLIYQPICMPIKAIDFTDFLCDVAYNVHLPLCENYDEINTLIDYIQSKPTPLIESIDQYILNNYPQVYSQYKVESNQNNLNDNIMPETVAFDTDDELSAFPETIATNNTKEFDEIPETIAFYDLSEADIMPETVALNNSSNYHISIIRVKTGEEIFIDKPYFVIGKSIENTDYCITDNNTISRVHAAITIENKDENYFLDLGSANHSYVEGVLATPNQKYRLYKSSRFYLSNEEFIFNIY